MKIMFNKPSGVKFAIVHLVFLVLVFVYALNKWYLLSPEKQNPNVLTIMFVLYTLFMIVDFPATIIYVLIAVNLDTHDIYKGLENWHLQLCVFTVVGSLWWYVIGGYYSAIYVKIVNRVKKVP
jgi:hypothetical protein